MPGPGSVGRVGVWGAGDASPGVDFQTSARVSGQLVTMWIPGPHRRPTQSESEPPISTSDSQGTHADGAEAAAGGWQSGGVAAPSQRCDESLSQVLQVCVGGGGGEEEVFQLLACICM